MRVNFLIMQSLPASANQFYSVRTDLTRIRYKAIRRKELLAYVLTAHNCAKNPDFLISSM